MADPASSVAVATGSLVVTGTATSFIAAENDLFCARGQTVPILRRDSPTQITLKQPWPVASLSGETAFNILSLGEYWRSAISINRRFADLLAKWEIVSPFKFDAAGTLAERDNYNNQPARFVYLAVDPLPVRVFVKLANTNSAADWSGPIYLGSGGQVEFQQALDQERNRAIQAEVALGQRADTITASLGGLRTDLTTEVARSTGKDSLHDSQISGLRTDLTAESGVARAAEAALGVRVDTEASERRAGDTANADAIGVVSDRLIRIEGDDGPGLGWLNDSSMPAVRVVLDDAGRLVAYSDALGHGARVGERGVLLRDGHGEDGPGLGWICDAATAPATTVTVTRSGRGLSYADAAGGQFEVDRYGTWRRVGAPEDGPGYGWLDAGQDSLAVALRCAPGGQLLEGRARGLPTHRLRFALGPNRDLIRIEDPGSAAPSIQAGPAVVIPPARIQATDGRQFDTPPAVLLSAAPGTELVQNEVTKLRAGGPYWLRYQFIRGSVNVERVSDSVVLVEGVDYSIDRDRGVVTGLKNVDQFDIRVTYTGTKQRVDYVVFNLETFAVSLVSGAEVARAPSLFEPAKPAGCSVIFRILRSANGAEVSPVHAYRDRVRIDRAQSIEAEIARQRRRVSKSRAKAMSGRSLIISGTGDSTKEHGGATPEVSNTSFNGYGRDLVAYFQAFDAAALAKIETYDLGDVYGKAHIRETADWRLVRFLRETYGATVEYRNRAISGTDSSDTVKADGFYNGTEPRRLAALVSDQADVVFSQFGMNELGRPWSYDTHCKLITALQAVGSDVVIVSSFRPNPLYDDNVERWFYTCARLRQAAEDCGAAFVDSTRIFAPQNLAAAGIASSEIAEANMLNHAGIAENRALGDLITELYR